MDLRDPVVGLRKTITYKNHSENSVEDPENRYKCALARVQLISPQRPPVTRFADCRDSTAHE
jgi:hypothetical protein